VPAPAVAIVTLPGFAFIRLMRSWMDAIDDF
jgi:hypothetical protein